MIKAAVIGHPIAHSLSPAIHGYWFREYGIAGDYRALDIAPADLAARVQELTDAGYSGFNVTVPHKQAVMALCDTLDETAHAIGAANTVVITNGRREGRNTDAFGFIANLKQSIPDFDFARGPAIVLGAGGAARAVLHGLLQEGVPEIKLANRTLENAQALAHEFPRVKVIDWKDREDACEGASLLINTTMLGMQGQADLEMNLTALPADAVVYDIVYKPLWTPLLQAAKARRLSAVTGIGMLLHQARPAFAAWTGTMPEVTAALEKIITERAR